MDEDLWIEEEVGDAPLGDRRRQRRLVRLVAALSARPAASVPMACQSAAATKAAYRFWDAAGVTPEAIQAAHTQRTAARCAGAPIVLAIQDTTVLQFTHPATTGLGPTDRWGSQGLLHHAVLMVGVDGVPLGLAHRAVWARDPLGRGRGQRRKRALAEKESQRWVVAQQEAEGVVAAETQVVTVADREGDLFALLALSRRQGSHLLIRAAHNRRVQGEARYLWEAVRRNPIRGGWDLLVHRKDHRLPRLARLHVRYAEVVVQPPRHARSRGLLQPVTLGVVLVEEPNPPPGVAPLCWLLYTTLPITTVEDARRMVTWYTYRWLIERYHYVLKSGCAIEELQLQTAARLKRALATYSVVAWRVLWLTYQARQHPDTTCASVLEPQEWQALYCFIHRTAVPPPAPPTLRQAVRWTAQLGGFLGRQGDGEPGPKTLWRGLSRLHDLAALWLLIHPGQTLPSPAIVGNE